jgi:hypothetical protein
LPQDQYQFHHPTFYTLRLAYPLVAFHTLHRVRHPVVFKALRDQLPTLHNKQDNNAWRSTVRYISTHVGNS